MVSFEDCAHAARADILDKTADWIYQAQRQYDELGMAEKLPVRLEGPPDAAVTVNHIKNRAWSAIDHFVNVRQRIFRDRILCGPCIIRRKTMAAEGDSTVKTMEKELVGDRPSRLQDDAVEGLGGAPRERTESDGDGEGGVEEVEEEMDPRRELIERLVQEHRGQVVLGRKERARPRKQIGAYCFKGMAEGIVKSFDPGFDSYHTGPTAEDVVGLHAEICAFYHSQPATARWSTVSERFSDHGYRRTAGGFHQFYLNPPSLEDQLAHFFPLPPKSTLDEWKEKNATTTQMDLRELLDFGGRTLPGGMLTGNDWEVWTLKRMVGPEAGLENTDQGMRTYITGKTNSGAYIRLDIHKSRQTVEDLKFSIDIDSIIWETSRLKVNGSINLHLLPYTGATAPIHKHNRTYTELYWPRTKDDVESSRISSASKEVPISHLPNTHFAHFGKTQGAAEVIVFFPRMKHKYPLRKMWETKIPYEVEHFWLKKVVYPALRALEDNGIKPYTQFDLEDTKFKKKADIMVSPHHLDKLQENIQEIIKFKAGDPSFARFGSFFFVLHILGIKVSTSMDADWTGLWEKVTSQNPNFDWDYMEDPENGELLVDLGFGIHPPKDSELVGFWDVDALHLGFDYGGYTATVTHSVSTVSAIGAVHAEMPSTRRKRTHIAYRLTYNLAYEVLRGRRTRLREGFFPISLAYDVNKKYVEDIEGVVDAYRRSRDKSYGVRDEYRCRARTMKVLLPHLEKKVRGRVPDVAYKNCRSDATAA